MNVRNLDSYVIKNIHIDCDKYVFGVLNNSIVKPLSEEMIIIINEKNIYLFSVNWR